MNNNNKKARLYTCSCAIERIETMCQIKTMLNSEQ